MLNQWGCGMPKVSWRKLLWVAVKLHAKLVKIFPLECFLLCIWYVHAVGLQ